MEHYILELTKEEVATLYVVLRNISGSPTESPRKYVDDIYDAVCTLMDMSKDDGRGIDCSDICDGDIHFKKFYDGNFHDAVKAVK